MTHETQSSSNAKTESKPIHLIERGLVGLLIHSPALIGEVSSHLKAEDFEHLPAATVYRAILSLSKQEVQIDENLIANYIYNLSEDLYSKIGREEAVYDMARCGREVYDVQAYVEQIKNNSLLRRLRRFAEHLESECDRPQARGGDVLGMAMREIEKLAQHNTSQHSVYVPDCIDDYLRTLSDGARHKGIVTGFTQVDAVLGQLLPGDVMIVAGRPGTGKTSWMLSIAVRAALRKEKVLFFSLEMAKEQIISRVCTAIAQINLSHLISGRLTAEEYSELQRALPRLKGMELWICDQSPLGVNTIYQIALANQYRFGLDLVVVDYLQLVHPDQNSRRENRQQEIAGISRAIKEMAISLNVAFIVGSQLSRQVELRPDKRPTLADLRESGSIEQDADIVMFLHRESPDMPNVVDVQIAKHRNGPLGSGKVVFVPARATFINPPTVEFGKDSQSD